MLSSRKVVITDQSEIARVGNDTTQPKLTPHRPDIAESLQEHNLNSFNLYAFYQERFSEIKKISDV